MTTPQDYQNAQTKYKAFIKGKVQRQVQIVKPDATPGRERDGDWGREVIVSGCAHVWGV